MKPMLLAFVATAVITFAAPYVLDNFGFSTESQTTSPWVRGG
ncbi:MULTISPECIES: hypothetical protein [unclassified Dinoroseobacter]